MQNRRVVMIVVVVLAVLIGGYYGIRAISDGSNGALKASGTIETTDISVGPEIGGKVAEVMASTRKRWRRSRPRARRKRSQSSVWPTTSTDVASACATAL